MAYLYVGSAHLSKIPRAVIIFAPSDVHSLKLAGLMDVFAEANARVAEAFYEFGLVAEEDRPIRSAEPVDVTLRNHRKDGSVFWNNLSLIPFTVAGELLYLGILRDVSTMRQTEIALERAANLDVATGCLNRQSFIVGAERRFATRAGPMLIVKLDVVSFHDINAGYGLDVGDALLREIGRRLRGTGAALVARIGANEFALACELTDAAGGPPMVAGVAPLSPQTSWSRERMSPCASRLAMRSAALTATCSP